MTGPIKNKFNKSLILAVMASLVPIVSVSQNETTSAPPKKNSETEQRAQSSVGTSSTVQNGEKADGKQSKPYKPSEEISEDSPVSFPVDI